MRQFDQKLAFIFGILIFSLPVFANDQMVFSIDLIRHGDRTPLHEIPNSPHIWKEGLGELTPKGMEQEYQLGIQFRKRYMEEYHLLPKQYHPELIYVRSTDINRTLMSADCVMLGLYPFGSNQAKLPKAYQPVPIHTVDINTDKLLLSEIENWQQNEDLPNQKLAHWSSLTGMKLEKPNQLVTLADNLYIRQLHHVALPDGINKQEAEDITNLGRQLFVNQYRAKENAYPVGHRVLHEVIAYFKKSKDKISPLRYVLFSAHDATILSVMATLGHYLDHNPPYSSDLNFSLFKKSDGEYYVKVSFNNEPLTFRECGGETCTLSEFSKLYA